MADSHNAKDNSKRNTYTHTIGRKLHENNSGKIQWGDSYKEFHLKAWTECLRVLTSGGIFILNIKDHIRKNQIIEVTQWHIDTLIGLGFILSEQKKIKCPGNRFGKNRNLRVEFESVIKFTNNPHSGTKEK